MKLSCTGWFAGGKSSTIQWLPVALFAFVPFGSPGEPTPIAAVKSPPHAPPPAPPIVVGNPHPLGLTPKPTPEGMTPYSIGEPTDEEQLYLEYINRARANPPAEGARLAITTDPDVLAQYSVWGVDLGLMQTQFDAIAPAPPVAMNAQLMTAARLHSQDMFTNMYQGHVGTDGSDPGQRITAQGYNWYTYGENVFANAASVFHGHAGFEVDWGPGTGGMQTPPGHRINIHNRGFREVGVGVVDGSNGAVGPQLVTEDFATAQASTPLITGVVYYDLNGNGFYDVGEGIGGVTVQVPGSTYYAVTAVSGGYAVPVTTNGDYAMTFSASGLTNYQAVATVVTQANVKVDYVPAYSPPVVSGPNPAALNEDNYYTFAPIGAATNYQWEETALVPYTAVEGAENGLSNVTVVSSPGYSVIISDLVASGGYAFHLAQPSPPTDQSLALNATILPAVNSQLSFAKRLGLAESAQIAHAQVSTNGGLSWEDVWSESGSGGSGDGSYATINVSLAPFAGLPTEIRFLYDFSGGYFFPQTDSSAGLCLDDIAVSDADLVGDSVTNNIPSGNSFAFYPTNSGDYRLRVRAQLPGRALPWGPATRVSTATLLPMTIQFVDQPQRSGNQFQADFSVSNYRTGTPFQLLTTTDLGGSWTVDSLASFQTLVSGSKFRVTTTNRADRAFFRIEAN